MTGSTQIPTQIDVYEALQLTPLDFQEEARRAYHAGESGLIQVPTGSGKTLAAVAGPLERMVAAPRDAARRDGVRLLYITPLRALSRDTERAVRRAVDALGAELTVECRTGDVPYSRRARQVREMPDILITTPESLSVLLARPGAGSLFAALHSVVVDEWHELLSSKRGTQTELALARLRGLRRSAAASAEAAHTDELRIWALSATIGNPAEAARAACGRDDRRSEAQGIPRGSGEPRVVTSNLERPLRLEVVEPRAAESLPWSGHLGLRMAPALLERLDPAVSTLIFTNTRKQAERWYQRLLELVPEQAHRIALHHGSIDREIRARIEEEARAGRVTWTVATSSLDLGIDFAPVETVVQIGSPKSIARLMQRAGRSAHQPGRTARMLFVPTHALELLEITAARTVTRRRSGAMLPTQIEERRPLSKPLDVLAQHLVTLACGDGFIDAELFTELRETESYAWLERREFDWVLDFVAHGGKSLGAYEHYRKLSRDDAGVWRVRDGRIAKLHRLSIGTIDGNSRVKVVFTNHRPVGSVEEQFVSKLRKGDSFYFAGRLLEFVMMKDFTVYVRSASGTSPHTPSWPGGALPLSPSMGGLLREFLDVAAEAGESGPLGAPPETTAATRHVLAAQQTLSALPRRGELPAEILRRRGRAHLFLYPFEGRPVHEGLAALLARRMHKLAEGSLAVSTNDYGLQMESDADYPFEELLHKDALFSPAGAEADAADTANIDELARRRFRGIARVSGLIFPGYPGSQKSTRRLQASAGLLYDVFAEHEPDNLLLTQARREVLRDNLNTERLSSVLERLSGARRVVVTLEKPSPLAFPLLVEQLSQQSSSLSMQERVERLRRQYDLAGTA